MMSKVLLNDRQLEAVNYIEGPLLILAGAGAGKTKTIVERVLNIISKGVEPRNILCVTFTNKAASEMRERVLHRMNEEELIFDYNNLPIIKTFHSLCMSILKIEAEHIGWGKNWTVIDPDDSRSIIKNFLDANDIDTKIYDPNKIKNIISREKNNSLSPTEYAERIGNFSMEITHRAWLEYEKALKESNSFDFDDLINKTLELLRDNNIIREKYNNIYKYIHIDEYQDTNNSQYKLCNLLVNRNTNNICVVGDTDQNIYSWRGANLKNIMNFEKDYPNTKVIILEENYRSTQNILNLANKSIEKNIIRKEKNLWSKNIAGELIEILPAWDEESEAECIAIKIREYLDKSPENIDIAILYRTNFQSRVLEEKMIAYNIPYIVLGTRFFDRKEIKDILSYVRVLINPNNKQDLKRVFENPRRGIGKVTLAKIFSGEDIKGSVDLKVQIVYKLLDEARSLSKTKNIKDILTFLLEKSGMKKSLEDDGEDGLQRLANISELLSIAKEWDESTFEESIDLFLERVSLSSDQDDDKKEKEGVRLMTIHAAKGLEFDIVFVVGLEEGLFPSNNFSNSKKTKEEEEEERRLFYVAVTRAKKKLYLSFAEMRTIFGESSINAPSIFLEDIIPDETIYNEMYFKKAKANFNNKKKWDYYSDNEGDDIYV